MYHAFPFWLVEFLLRNQLIAWWEFPGILFVIFPLLLLIFYLPLVFISLITVWVCSSLGLSCLGLSVLPGLGWLFPFPCLGNFQQLSLQIFSQVLSLSSPSRNALMWMLVHLMLSQRSLRLSSFLVIPFFFFFYSAAVISTILSSRLFCYWFLLLYSSFQLLYC